MLFFLFKTLISAIIIAAASELAKRSSFLGALLISLPTMSILSMIWIYIETKDVEKISTMSWNILWLILLTLPFFVIIPSMIKRGVSFPISLIVACSVTMALCLGAMRWLR